MAESSRQIRELCTSIINKLQEEIDSPEAMNVALPTSVEIPPSTEPIEGVHGPPPKSQIQFAQIALEVTTEKTPSLSRTKTAISLLEPPSAGSFSEWRCPTNPPWSELRWTSSLRRCLSHARLNNPTPPPPPEPPDLSCHTCWKNDPSEAIWRWDRWLPHGGCAVPTPHSILPPTESARRMFESVKERDHVAWNFLINGRDLNGRPNEAWTWLLEVSLEAIETTYPSLSWETLHEIAIGIARGLEYLHKGCKNRILHFGIKPHNILLGENYHPKISDFGLAHLSIRVETESIILMSISRGTIGYIAPEVWNRSFGGVSHKSDVHSYGMMLLCFAINVKTMVSDPNFKNSTFVDELVICVVPQMHSKVDPNNPNFKGDRATGCLGIVIGFFVTSWALSIFEIQSATEMELTVITKLTIYTMLPHIKIVPEFYITQVCKHVQEVANLSITSAVTYVIVAFTLHIDVLLGGRGFQASYDMGKKIMCDFPMIMLHLFCVIVHWSISIVEILTLNIFIVSMVQLPSYKVPTCVVAESKVEGLVQIDKVGSVHQGMEMFIVLQLDYAHESVCCPSQSVKIKIIEKLNFIGTDARPNIVMVQFIPSSVLLLEKGNSNSGSLNDDTFNSDVQDMILFTLETFTFLDIYSHSHDLKEKVIFNGGGNVMIPIEEKAKSATSSCNKKGIQGNKWKRV